MYKIAAESLNLKEELAYIIRNINLLEFEERKNMQLFITELYNNFTEVIEETLDFRKNEIVTSLIEKYIVQGMSPFAGNLLRLFTKSTVFVIFIMCL